ncbi:MAG: PilW family protein [Planctomycetota bacterium]|jgi:hypothetical protein
MTSKISSAHPVRTSRNAGFTLAELLLASVLGAMLLTALGVATFGFTQNLEYHEQKAGVGSDSDPILRRITRDVREAWWIDLESPSHIEISDPDGAITKYYLSGSDLKIERPNGDTGVLIDDVESLDISASFADRNRDGALVDYDTVWYSQVATSGAPVTLKTELYEEIGVGFVAPADQGDIPGFTSGTEQVASVATSIVQLPIAWIPGSGPHQFELSVFESRGPGSAKPTGNALAVVSLPGASLPQAVAIDEDAGIYEVPTTMVPFSVGASLEPGVGYVFQLDPQGDSEIVVQADPIFPDPSNDDVAVGDYYTGTWTEQPLLVPVTITGPFSLTSTSTVPAITRLTFDLTISGAATQTRSAAILSQVITGDPWLGTVPGEPSP